MSTELDRLDQKVTSLTGTLNDAKTIQEWTDRTIDGSTLLSPGTDQDIVPYVKASYNFRRNPHTTIPFLLGGSIGIYTYMVLGINYLEMILLTLGVCISSGSLLQSFFWSRSDAKKQQKTLEANLENVVDGWLYERYKLQVSPFTKKKIIRNLLAYDARTFKFKALGSVTARMSCNKRGWFVHDIKSGSILVPSVDDNLVRFALRKYESYQKVQMSRYNRELIVQKAKQRQEKEQMIRDGLAKAEAYAKNNKKPAVRSYEDKNKQDETLRSYQQARIDELTHRNHELTKRLHETTPPKSPAKDVATTEKALPAKVASALNALQKRLSVLTELQLDTESTHVMERIQNESKDAVDVFKQLQKLNRETQAIAEVLAVLNGLVSDADMLLDNEANKLKNKLVTSETFLKATRNSALRLEKPSQ